MYGPGAPAATASQCAEAVPADNHGCNRADSAQAAAITDAARGEVGDMLRPSRLQILFLQRVIALESALDEVVAGLQSGPVVQMAPNSSR